MTLFGCDDNISLAILVLSAKLLIVAFSDDVIKLKLFIAPLTVHDKIPFIRLSLFLSNFNILLNIQP